MRTISVIAARTFGRLAGQITTSFSVAVFLAAAGSLFALGLFAAEGKLVSTTSVWAISIVHVLPVLAALVTMRLWTDYGVAGLQELDLVAPVPERMFAIGRFLAAYAVVALAVLLSMSIPLVMLPRFTSSLSTELSAVRFMPALVAVLILAVPATAVGSMFGACIRRAAPAAVVTVAVTYALPYALYRSMMTWSPAARMRFAESPILAHVADAADGFFSVGAAVAMLAFAGFALYATSKAFATRRLACSGRLVLKCSSAAAVLSAFVAALMLALLAFRIDSVVEWPGATRTAAFSARTREILSGVSRPVRISTCIRRDSAQFLPTARLLRTFADLSRSAAGAEIKCEFVDPRWDPNAASRLARYGAGEDTIVFSAGRRRMTVPVKDADESMCASAIQRLSMPAKSETVLFTTGHGEPAIDDFGPAGLGDAVRSLKQDGYQVHTFLSVTSQIPTSCAVLAVVGARLPFSAAELTAVRSFLAQGGRLLATLDGDAKAGVGPLLESYGMSAGGKKGDAPTTDGSDVVVSTFGDHSVSRPLDGVAVVFAPDALSIRGKAQDKEGGGFVQTPLCLAGTSALAVAAEKGAALKSDLAIRPARIVVIGDRSFFLNEALASRANANRDFFLNSMAWLAGLDVSGASGVTGNVLSAQMDRSHRVRFVASSSVALPLAVLVCGITIVARKRRRRK